MFAQACGESLSENSALEFVRTSKMFNVKTVWWPLPDHLGSTNSHQLTTFGALSQPLTDHFWTLSGQVQKTQLLSPLKKDTTPKISRKKTLPRHLGVDPANALYADHNLRSGVAVEKSTVKMSERTRSKRVAFMTVALLENNLPFFVCPTT